MKNISYLLCIFPILVGCSYSIDLGSPGIITNPIFNVDVSGKYEGTVHYYVNDSVIPGLSYSGSLTTVINKTADIYVLSFDTAILYTIPDLEFILMPNVNTADIKLTSGQEYIIFNRSLFETTHNIVFYNLSIQSISPDSTYNLRMYGQRR